MTLLAILLALEVGDGEGNLAERLQRRDPQAFAELYDRYGRLVYSIILAIVRDRASQRTWYKRHFCECGIAYMPLTSHAAVLDHG